MSSNRDDCYDNNTDCWQLTVTGGETLEENKPVCWELHVSSEVNNGNERDCWSVSLSDNCSQPPPIFDPTDIDMDKHGIFRVYAVHIQHSYIYMAVQMREPDDPNELTYLDEWASATEEVSDGQFIYRPTYKATEIVKVFDIFGDLEYTEMEDEYGYKYITRPEYDINFNIIYRMDMGLRIVKGVFASEWAIKQHYMLAIESAMNNVSSDLIGDGCLLMGKEGTSFSDPIIFTAKNGNSYRLKDEFGEISLFKLGASNLNYMLTTEIALKHDSSTGYNVVEDIGTANLFHNYSDGLKEIYHVDKIVGIMQSNEDTVGFIESSEPDKLGGLSQFWCDLYYQSRYKTCSDGGWTGGGEVGSVVDAQPAEYIEWYSKSIMHPPIVEEYDTKLYECGYTFIGMIEKNPVEYDGDYTLDRYDLPDSQKKRIDFGDNFAVVLNNGLVFINKELEFLKPYSLWFLYDKDTISDFCHYYGNILIADRTNIIKVRSVV